MQFFYAYLTIHAVAGDRPAVYRFLNRAPLFWKTNLGALQTSSFIVLGRIFDQSSGHNVDRLLKIGQTNLGILQQGGVGRAQAACRSRRRRVARRIFEGCYVPTPKDFRHLRLLVRKYRATYEAKYRDLRHKLFAHKEVSNPADVSTLFAKTNVRELQRILLFLLALYDALWMLFVNGHKPILRMRRYSVARIRKKPSEGKGGSLQERLIREIEQFLTTAAAQPVASARN